METIASAEDRRPRHVATPIGILCAEHTLIREVLRAMTRALDEGGCFEDQAFWSDAVSFLEGFGDRCHHRKEECVLFPRLEMRGVARTTGPIAAMLVDHEQVRTLLRSMSQLLPALASDDVDGPRDQLRRAARRYCELLAFHIAKEEGVLFPLAERLLSPDDTHDLMQRFALFQGKPGDADTRRLVALADRIRHAA